MTSSTYRRAALLLLLSLLVSLLLAWLYLNWLRPAGLPLPWQL